MIILPCRCGLGVRTQSMGKRKKKKLFNDLLVRAAENRYLKAFKRHLKDGASEECMTAALSGMVGRGFLTTKSEDLEIVSLLLENGADLDRSNALWKVSGRGDLEAMQMFLDLGASVHGSDEYQRPLEKATYHNKLEAVRLLLDHGAKPKHADLSMVASHRNLEMLELLLERGLVPTKRSLNRATSILINSDKRDSVTEKMVERLLKLGADPACALTEHTIENIKKVFGHLSLEKTMEILSDILEKATLEEVMAA